MGLVKEYWSHGYSSEVGGSRESWRDDKGQEDDTVLAAKELGWVKTLH